MRFIWLIWSGVYRKKMRAILTGLSIFFAFLLYGVLQGVNQGFDSLVTNLGVDRLVTVSRVSFTEPLPLSHGARIAAVPGVAAVAHATFMGGYYQDSTRPINSFAADVLQLFTAYPELRVDAKALNDMTTTRAGALIDRSLAVKYGWQVGDRVPLGSSIWQRSDGGNTWEVDIVGIVDSSALGGGLFSDSVWLNYEYLDEARQVFKGTVLQYIVKLKDPREAHAVSTAVDAMFANSTDETSTQTEQAAAQSMIKQLADVNFIANAIVSAVFFALCFVTVNTMSQAVRERRTDFGVLKTLGFSDARVGWIVLLEATFLYVPAALLGMLFAATMLPAVGAMLGLTSIPESVYAGGVFLAFMLAAFSALPPALRISRLRVVDALAPR